nr:DUF1972 domain-containing protein [Vibrio coralliilyticus]
MRVAVVGTVGIPACYGGFESLVENLTAQQQSDVQYIVFCSKKSYKEQLDTYNDAELIYLPLCANGSQSVPYDILSLIKCWTMKPDVVLILGVSGCLFLPMFRLFSSAKVVTNIDGLEWKRDKWGKWAKKFLKWSEFFAVKFSDVVITDNQAIGDYVKSEYDTISSTIAYGGDHALRENVYFGDVEESYALGLCRIEPENNVAMILEAFSQSTSKIKFVGNWNYSEFGRVLREKYSVFPNIELYDPIYDLDELYKLRRGCSLYLHGHSAGGTNPSLVEMMHFSVPIFAYDCVFNRYSTDNLAHYFSSTKDLLTLISDTSLISKNKNAESMKYIAKNRYTWREISRMYISNF